MHTLFVTGATGHLGVHTVRSVLRDTDTRVVALVRADDDAHLAKRLAQLRERVGPGSERLDAVRGDITAPGLGLDAVPDVDAILHGAAAVRFDLPIEETVRQNVEGTRNVAQLARKLASAGRLQRLDYVGTCYVAGDRRGRVHEHELDVGQGFRNAYEKSKCEAEKVVRELQAEGVPAAIHRPSIVVGESTTGATRAFNVIYGPLRSYLLGRWRICPGDPEALVDVVPVDWVADATAKLRRDPATIGKCHALAVGDAAPTVRQIEHLIREIADAPPLIYVDQQRYFRWIRPVLAPFFWTKRGRLIERGALAYMPYFLGNPLFDTTVARAGLGDLTPPDPRAYFEAIVRFALARSFRAKEG